MATTTGENKELVQEYLVAWDNTDSEPVSKVLAEDFVFNHEDLTGTEIVSITGRSDEAGTAGRAARGTLWRGSTVGGDETLPAVATAPVPTGAVPVDTPGAVSRGDWISTSPCPAGRHSTLTSRPSAFPSSTPVSPLSPRAGYDGRGEHL